MPTKNGWKTHVIGILSAAILTMGAAMFTLGAGKASKKDVEKLKTRDVEQQVLNENIRGRLQRLDEGQKELKAAVGALPKAVADELRNNP